MPQYLKRALLLICGIAFILLGIVGLVLPFLQGILFIAIGIILLSILSPRFRAFIEIHTRKFPRLHNRIKGIEVWIVKVFGLE
jgi:uncharacterized membrane protein YbaN (DUF454 family)